MDEHCLPCQDPVSVSVCIPIDPLLTQLSVNVSEKVAEDGPNTSPLPSVCKTPEKFQATGLTVVQSDHHSHLESESVNGRSLWLCLLFHLLSKEIKINI